MRHSLAPSRRRPARRVGEHRLDRPAARPGRAAARSVYLRRVDLAGQARDLGAVGVEQHHRRVAADLEARAELLRARAVAVDVDGDEGARALDEVLAVEQRRLELVARRAPVRAPVQQHRLALGAGLRERGVDVGIAAACCQAMPGGVRRPPGRGRRSAATAAGVAGATWAASARRRRRRFEQPASASRAGRQRGRETDRAWRIRIAARSTARHPRRSARRPCTASPCWLASRP